MFFIWYACLQQAVVRSVRPDAIKQRKIKMKKNLNRKKTWFLHLEKFYILVLIIFISGTGYSQSKYPYWSVAATGGLTLPVGDFGDSYDACGNVGGDVIFHFNPNWSVIGNVTYNFLGEIYRGSVFSGSGYLTLLSNSHYLEVTTGVRRYYVRETVKAYGETEIGLYSYHVDGYTLTTSLGTAITPSITENDFGLNVGGGVEIPLSKAVDILGKLKYHAIFTSYTTKSYIGFYGGLNVNFP
ncbi:hypothetical protein ACFLSV_02015 [Bacteroidota bacterium]